MNYSIGITSWCWPDFSAAAMPEIKKAGLDALQLQVGNWEDGLPLSDKALQKAYAEAAAAAGLKLLPVSVNTVCQHPFTEGLDTPDGSVALKALDAGVEAAAGMKAEGITVPNFGRNKILSPAGLENTILATENLLSSSGLEQLLADCPFPNLYFLFDSHNYRLHGLDYAVDVLQSWYGRTGSHLHVKAGTREGSAPLGSGDSPVEDVLAFLKEKDYAGSIVLENDYVNPPLRSKDLRFMLEDIRFIRRRMAEA